MSTSIPVCGSGFPRRYCRALEQFLGSGAGLSASTTTRLTSQWQDEAAAFGRRDLSGSDYVYLWVDGIHLKVASGAGEVVGLLVMIGVRADGRKELVALTDGYRESTRVVGRSAARLPPPRHDRTGTGGRRRRPSGSRKRFREVFPTTKEQRCWFHKQANVVAALPKSAHPSAFEVDFGAKYPKAVAKIVDDLDVPLEFYR